MVRVKQFKGGGLLNTLINKLPVELHIPGYQYCGPGTKLQERLERGDPGKNPLDRACKAHDIAYSHTTELGERHKADRELAAAALDRVRAGDASVGEKLAALGVAGVMKAKVVMGAGLKKRYGCKTKKNKNKKKKKTARKGGRRIRTPKKVGGFLPLLLAGLGALGSAAGGAAGIAKAVNEAKAASKRLAEAERHNKAVEAMLLKKGRGLQLHPWAPNSSTWLSPRVKKKLPKTSRSVR